MFDFWYDLPPILRAGMGLLMMAISVGIYFGSDGSMYAYGLFSVGLILLLFCKAGDSGGYNF